MRLLLDTHIFLWSLLEPERLTAHVASELENQKNELWLSPISAWEVLLLSDKGRVALKVEPAAWVRDVLGTIPFTPALLNMEVALQSRSLSLPHRDPADRFLAATAKVYDLTLVTADERLLACSEISVLPNKA